MLAFTAEPGNEDLQGQWIIKETFAGDANRIFVLAEQNGIEKKLWIARSLLTEVDAPEVSETPAEEVPAEETPE
jgi:hypothetical protein